MRQHWNINHWNVLLLLHKNVCLLLAYHKTKRTPFIYIFRDTHSFLISILHNFKLEKRNEQTNTSCVKIQNYAKNFDSHLIHDYWFHSLLSVFYWGYPQRRMREFQLLTCDARLTYKNCLHFLFWFNLRDLRINSHWNSL